MKRMFRIAPLVLMMLSAGSVAADQPMSATSLREQYIVMARHLVALPNATPSPSLISDAELEALGGIVSGRGSDRVIVDLPAAALGAVLQHPGVKYAQRAVLGPQPVVIPSEMTATAEMSALARAPLRTEVQWASGNYLYDGAGNIKEIGSTHVYRYDGVSRLVSATVASTNSESYSYDDFGNMTGRVTNGVSFPAPADVTTNRLSGVTYDTAGNVVVNGTVAYAWDPFSMMREHHGSAGQQDFYMYTASDERIAVKSGERWVWSLRDESGKVLRQYDSLAAQPTVAWRWIEDYVYRDGLLLGAERPAAEGGRRHFHLDHLGTPKLVTGANGLIVSQHEYFPFGNEITPWHSQEAGFDREEPMRFTGHERDFVGGTSTPNTNYLDYMHARFTNPGWRRFLSVDDKYRGKPSRPQSWNRYSYASNSPIVRVDPDGNEDVLIFKTQRNPARDPRDPWGLAAQWMKGWLRQSLRETYSSLNFKVIEVSRVSQVVDALANGDKIVRVVFIGHADKDYLAIGNAAAPGTNISTRGGPNDVDPSAIDWSNLTSDAKIILLGCHTGEDADSIAAAIAESSGAITIGADSFLNFNEVTGEPFFRWWRSGHYHVFRDIPDRLLNDCRGSQCVN